MEKREKQVLDRFKSLLVERLPVHQMILFGSRARGDADIYSDMDIVVVIVGPADEQIRDFVSDCAWEAGFEEGIVVVPVVFTREEWELGPERLSLLAQAVRAEGVSI